MENKEIVIIDEDRKFLGELEEVLSRSGYAPVVINDARLAVDIVTQRKPDVILLELRMPHKDGFELADEINYAFDTKQAPIIAMSAFLKDKFEFLLNLYGIKGYLKKPFNPLDLIWAIENVTEGSDQWDKEMCLENVG